MSVAYQDKASAELATLGLTAALTQLDSACQRAAAEGWSYSHFLGYLLEAEVNSRHQKIVDHSLQFSNLPYLKDIAHFDFAAQPSIDRRLIEELLTGRYLAEGRNIIFQGPPGVGKTHLAIGLAVAAAQQAHRVYFISAVAMVRRLSKALTENRFQRPWSNLISPKLLVIDEMGYLSLDSAQASLLFQIIATRYDKNQPIILTSNKAFSEWNSIFAGDSIMAAAALDRLLHRSTVINIRGESYRLMEKRKAGFAFSADTINLSQTKR